MRLLPGSRTARTGYLNTDWGDSGHLQQSVISEPPFAYGAAVSWCLETNADLDLAAVLSTHVFDDPTQGLADALLAIGDAHLLVTPQFPNMSAAVANLYYPQLPVGRGLTKGLTAEELDALEDRLEEARRSVDHARSSRPDAALLIDETRFSIDLVELLVDDAQARLHGDGRLGAVPDDARDELARRLGVLTDRYRELWLSRNRPGGLDDSVRWLDNLRSAYETGRPDPTWGGLSAGSA